MSNMSLCRLGIDVHELDWFVPYVCHFTTLGSFVTEVKPDMHSVVRVKSISGLG